MTETERIKKAIKWLIGSGIAKTQEGIGLLMGYSNKSAFSQVVNNTDKRPEDFVVRLCNLNNTLNKNWLLTGEGSMLKNTDQPVSQGGEDATLSEADLNNSNTMKKYLDQVLRQNEELIRQNGVLLDLFREERAKNKGEVALKKEG
jgi:hypothetical protein